LSRSSAISAALQHERQEVLVPAGIAANPGEAFGQVLAAEKLLHDPADDRTVEAVLLLVPLCVDCLEFGEVILHALIEG
jgi:hypothetical protein